MYALLAKREDKIARYWTSFFFLGGGGGGQKRGRPLSSHLDLTSMVNK